MVDVQHLELNTWTLDADGVSAVGTLFIGFESPTVMKGPPCLHGIATMFASNAGMLSILRSLPCLEEMWLIRLHRLPRDVVAALLTAQCSQRHIKAFQDVFYNLGVGETCGIVPTYRYLCKQWKRARVTLPGPSDLDRVHSMCPGLMVMMVMTLMPHQTMLMLILHKFMSPQCKPTPLINLIKP
eukprot:1158725-Pelagomonas_calceolata.AAC.3